MGNTTKQAPDPKLQKLGTLRVALCVIAVALCGSIVISAVNLRPKPKEADTEAAEVAENGTAAKTENADPEAASLEENANVTDSVVLDTPSEEDEADKQDSNNIVNGTSSPGSSFGKDPSQGISETTSDGKPIISKDDQTFNKEDTDPNKAADTGTDELTSDPTTEPSVAPDTEPSETLDSELSEASDSELSEASDSELSEASDSEPSETPDSELSETPDSELSETPDSELSATLDSESPETPTPEPPAAPSWPLPMLIGSIVLLALDAIGIGVCSQSIQHRKHELRQQRRRAAVAAATATAESEDEIIHTQSLPEQPVPGRITVGSLQNIGGRPYQEDSSGVANLSDGALAVVADGMGGLSNGDKVSQKIIFTMMGFAKALRPGQMDGVLFQMVKGTVDVVNRMLGKDGLYKSGSTLMAVLVRGGRFHWIAVGDSHIYLFRDGQLIQLNQEHNRGQDLLRHAIAGELTFDEVRADPKKSGLTSFIGMGEIKYVEKSLDSIALHPGDRIVLMTDGVFNALSDSEIAAVLAQNPDVKTAARMMEQGVLSKAAPHQDNFTAVILGL